MENSYSLQSLSPSNKVNLLIVEDDEVDQASYVRYLEKHNPNQYHFLQAETIEYGLHLLQLHQPDIILIDIGLPDGNGLELLQFTNKNLSQQQARAAIVLTGRGDEATAVKAMKLGAADYLVKGDLTSIALYKSVQQAHDRINLNRQLETFFHQEAIAANIALRIRQSLDLEAILSNTAKEIRQHLNADRVAIFQFSPAGGGTIVAESVASSWKPAINLHIGKNCFTESRYNVNDAEKFSVINNIYAADLSECHRALLEELQARSSLTGKLIINNTEEQTLWGELIVHQCSSFRQWSDIEKHFINQLSTQLSISIQQATLHEKVKESERNLNDINRSLLHATQMKDAFLASMSHELRTPLTAIMGMSEALRGNTYGSLNRGQQGAVKLIEDSSVHLLELIDDVLDIAKVESGQIDLNLVPTQLASLCQSSAAFVRPQAERKNIQLTINHGVEMPCILLDERRIRQVLINLLDNAIKFTPANGHVSLDVTFKQHTSTVNDTKVLNSDCVEISVTDTGIGIAPENRTKIFEPFVQIDNTLNRQFNGTGLGLAIVKHIVDAHGGSISTKSQSETGSCFTVCLPCTDIPDRANSKPFLSSNLASDQTGTKISNPILLVENDEATILTIFGYLTAKGHSVLVARDGTEGVSLAESTHPHLILMDIEMPDMKGFEAMRRIRQHDTIAHTPIIALTALAMKGDKERFLAAGANEYLSKPIRLKHLLETINTYTEARIA
ncbi:MAG: response regulator [Cyanobacteria bacterium P01_H01_bin.105]